MSSQGIVLPQEAIVIRVKGVLANGTASIAEMVFATNMALKDVDDQLAVASGQYVIGPPQPPVLYNHLHHRRPVILTYSTGAWAGHAVVLYGIDATVTEAGVQIVRFYVADPFPFKQVMGPFGQPALIEDTASRFRVYDVQGGPYGLMLLEHGTPVGVVQGMILVDASRP